MHQRSLKRDTTMFAESLASWVRKKFFVLNLVILLNAVMVIMLLWWPQPLDTLGRMIMTGYYSVFGLVFPLLFIQAFRSIDKPVEESSRQQAPPQ